MSAPLSEQQLAEIRSRAEAATEGPWGAYEDSTGRLDIVASLKETGYGYTGRRQIAQTVDLPMDNDPNHRDWDDEADEEQSRADGKFIAAARTDVPLLLAEVDRLRTERDEFADRVDTLTSVAKGNKRHVQEMYAELAAPRELFLAEYEMDEPQLFLTLDAARDALTTARNTGDPLVPWAWQEQDGVWSQWRTDQDDRPVELLLGSVMRVALPAGLLAGAAEQQATAGPYVWQVWEEDGPLYGVYATQADAEQGTIDCYRDMGESCPDYSWRWTSTGTQGELLAGDGPVGIWLARHKVRSAKDVAAAVGAKAGVGVGRCGRCRRPFDPADTRFDGHAEYRDSGYCRSCIDLCHNTEIADHRCPICAGAGERS